MSGYACTLCGGDEAAVLLITPLTGGDTMPVGENCMAVGLTGMLSAYLDVDAEQLYDAVKAFSEAKAAESAAPPAKAPRGRPKAAKAPPGAEAAKAGASAGGES